MQQSPSKARVMLSFIGHNLPSSSPRSTASPFLRIGLDTDSGLMLSNLNGVSDRLEDSDLELKYSIFIH